MASASIFQQYLKPPRSMQEYSADMDAAEQNKLALIAQRQQNELGGMKLGQERQAMADAETDRNALQAVASRWAADTPTARKVAELRATNNPRLMAKADAMEKTALEMDKTRADVGKTTAETGKTNEEILGKRIDQYRSHLSYIDTREGAMRWLEAQYADPVTAPFMNQMAPLEVARQRMAQVQDINEWRQQVGMGLEKYAQNLLARGNSAEVARHNRVTEGQTARRDSMTDARVRESNSASMSKPFEVTGEDGRPVLVQQDKQGNVRPVAGYNPKSVAGKPLNDAQSKAALFGARMEEADKVLAGLAKEGTTTSIPGARAGFGVGATLNVLSTDKQQKLNQAKRDFVNAVLRRESGAVISDAEFDNAEKQYFPQVGDGDAVKKQKANNRAIAIRGVQAEVPKASQGVIGEIRGSPAKPGAAKFLGFE